MRSPPGVYAVATPTAQPYDTNELAQLGRALDARDAEWPDAVAATPFPVLAGSMRREVFDV